MSYGKRRMVSVESEELASLRRKAAEASSEKRRRAQAEANTRAERKKRKSLDRQLRQEADRRGRLEERMAGLGTEVASLERRTADRLERERRAMRDALERQGSDLHDALAHSEAQLRRTIARSEAELRSEIEQGLETIHARERVRSRAAERWLETLGTEIESIEQELLHDHFAPGELERLRTRHSVAAANLDADVPQAAIAGAQEAWCKARTLRHRLELEHAEWGDLRRAAIAEVEIAEAELDSLRRVELRLEGQAPHDLDVDFWSEGRLSELAGVLTDHRERVEDESVLPSSTDLRVVLEELEDLRERAIEVAGEARDAGLHAVVRADMVSAVFEELSRHGYELVGNEWDDGDERRANRLYARSSLGERMVVTVEPARDADGKLANQLQVYFGDHSPSDSFRRERLAPVQSVLSREFGVPEVPFEAIPGMEESIPRELLEPSANASPDGRAATAKDEESR